MDLDVDGGCGRHIPAGLAVGSGGGQTNGVGRNAAVVARRIGGGAVDSQEVGRERVIVRIDPLTTVEPDGRGRRRKASVLSLAVQLE